MGADGGTVPKRGDQVKQKRKEEKIEGIQSAQLRLTNCALTGQPLARKSENLACDAHGNLFNLESLLESLVDAQKKKLLAKKFGIKKMKDIIKLHALLTGDFTKEDRDTTFVAPFQCPFTGHLSNGIIKFVVLRPCGHVLTHRALKEMAGENKENLTSAQQPSSSSEATSSTGTSSGSSGQCACPICQKSFSWQQDVIEIVPQVSVDGASSPSPSEPAPTSNGTTNSKKRAHDAETQAPDALAAAEEEQQEPLAKKPKVA